MRCMEAIRRITWTLVLLLFAVGASADIALLASSPSKVAFSLQSLLAEKLQTPVILITDHTKPLNSQEYDVAIAIGSEAIEAYDLPDTLPVIAAFVSQSDYRKHAKRLASAVFVEPSFERQLRLARAILGGDSKFGVLVQGSAPADVVGKDVYVYSVSEFDTLNHALVKLLAENQALIGAYDPELFSSDNIKNILITAYRHNRPLIGPSSAYLRAGALATTYSNLDDIAQRLGDIVTHFNQKEAWPPADFNPYFRIGFNEQVGRSLNLLLPDIDKVTQTLHQQESGQ